MTKAEKVIELLEKKGCKEIQSRSRKYRTFTRPDAKDKFYFVGRKGALRTGRSASKSISLTHMI